jgi:hypothetical protein
VEDDVEGTLIFLPRNGEWIIIEKGVVKVVLP